MIQADRERFPTVIQAGLLLLASIVLQHVVGAALYDARGVLDLTLTQLGALVLLLANGILLTAVMHHRRMSYRDLIHPAKASATATALLIIPPVLLLVPLLILANQLLSGLLLTFLPLSAEEEQVFASLMEPSLAATLAACVLAPVLEEMLFRGVILRSFLHQYPRGAAIGASALYFGVAHLNVYQFVVAFILGLLLGWLYERCRSLLPCIALHAAYNGVVTLQALSAPDNAHRPLGEASLLPWVVAIAAAAAAATLLRHFLARSGGAASRPST